VGFAYWAWDIFVVDGMWVGPVFLGDFTLATEAIMVTKTKKEPILRALFYWQHG
tara:strand:+ start:14244 stop:14405 length:162 start_codon:yes stop_codon:yes gene_type:complete